MPSLRSIPSSTCAKTSLPRSGMLTPMKVEAFVQAALDKGGCDIAPTARVNSLSRTDNLGRDGTESGGFSDPPDC